MSTTITRGIRIDARPRFLATDSQPEADRYVFAYDITITNEGPSRVQLDSRHWIITNADGDTHHVRGPGVVGEHPSLAPGESFQYTSFCPLNTPVGAMEGSFHMVDASGERFEARIAPFRLSRPGSVN